MLVTAIADEKFSDDFGVSFEVGEVINGYATRYSQKHIWIDIMLDTSIEPKNEDEFLYGILQKTVKIKVKSNSIKREKCEYCENYAKEESYPTCGDEDCAYKKWQNNQPDDYSLVQDYSCGGWE